jgi:fructose-1,6-bisphosphatase I
MNFEKQKLYAGFIEIASLLKYNDNNLIIKDKCDNILINKISNMNLCGYINNNSIYPTLFFSDSNVNEEYIISFSTLDGIKNLNSNISIGSIYCIYKFDRKNNLLQDIIVSGYCLYGTKTILVESDGKQTSEFRLNQHNIFVYHQDVDISEKNNKLYAINSSRTYDQDLNNLIKSFKRDKYNQRWIGSMVADCHNILKNGGLFLYPNCEEFPKGKLNYIIQVLPLCFIFQGAGGIGIIGNRTPILKKYKQFNLIQNNCKYVSDIILCNLNEYKNIINILDIEENIRC